MPKRRTDPTVIEPLQLPTRMAASDALFWYAETALPIFRPLIAGLYILDRSPDPRGLDAGYEASLAVVPRLRQRVVEPEWSLAFPEYVDDAHFDRSYHLRHLSLPAPGTMRELLDLVASVFATPLDRQRPLWESYLIEGLEGGRAAYFLKMHHSLVDGVGSVAIVNALTQRHRTATVPRVARAGAGHRTPATPASDPLALALGAASELGKLAWRAATAPAQLLTDPVGSAHYVGQLARGVRGLLGDLGSETVTDPLVGSSTGLSRRFDVMEVDITRLKQIAKPLGVTLNDVVLTALAGTLGAYHRERRVHVDSLTCMVPMNLRTADESSSLGNRVGVFNIHLPVSEKRVDRRLERIVRQTRAAKSDRRGALYPFFVQTLTALPATALRWLARQSLGKVNVACTNVPGVPERRYMAGARVEAIYPFAAVVQGTPLVMALFSYAGTMDIGFDTDPEAIPDPHRIAELFEAALEEVAAFGKRAPR